MKPRGYKEQTGIPCCANCVFGGYLGAQEQPERMAICEVMGECESGAYSDIAVEPLGICDAWNSRAGT